MSSPIMNTGDVLSFKDYNENVRLLQKDHKDAIVASIYMFSMNGCPPCRTSMQILFGGDTNNVWQIAVRNFREQLPQMVTTILEGKLKNFDSSSATPGVAQLYQFVYEDPKIDPKERINQLTQMFCKNFYLIFVQLDRERDSVTIEEFGVRAFPSWTIGVDSEFVDIKHKNNKLGLRTGGFPSPAQFFEWFNHSMRVTLDGLCESALVGLLLKHNNKY